MTIVAALQVSGCSTLGEGGPTSQAILSQSSMLLPYTLVPVTPAIVAVLNQNEPDRLAGRFTDNRPPARLTLGVGDVVAITVYEAGTGGLLIPGDASSRPGNFVNLPGQAIDNAGNITFPYGGHIRAAGLTTRQLQDAILARIKDRAIEPQVVVTVTSQQANLISVQGEVKNPLRYPAAASGAGDRVSDAITRAGGIMDQGFETFVVLDRDGKRATVPFEALLIDRENDVFVRPGDKIFLYREPQKFIAFGATEGRQAEIPFDSWRISLAEAIAKAGGLVDTRADPGSVFLYRREPVAVASKLGVDASRTMVDVVPVVFSFDLGNPAGFFTATQFKMKNGDLLYIANSKSVEISKAVGFFNSVTSTAVSASTAALAVQSAVAGRSSALPTVGGLTVVPSGITGLPGTITTNGISNGVSGTMSPTGGTADTPSTSAPTAGSTNTTVSLPAAPANQSTSTGGTTRRTTSPTSGN
ncbi:polysaccharide biosynthesis/export family protein [Lichenifustis flavocetrariae]|uniref:Polysaccharide biosynthesis/export family protein n=1 Tax=Lichenifustis flavocetrariae TaxID=2949735 RepID=A0AA41Z4K1_9HYPH|nr:polysaccharide biosynthesis/export family protein [Lichenifustis flavocetrariae]MCW6510195.1 polysaccharide biosynthesis/export family protein [Lichenifustis flavocetrariae]